MRPFGIGFCLIYVCHRLAAPGAFGQNRVPEPLDLGVVAQVV